MQAEAEIHTQLSQPPNDEEPEEDCPGHQPSWEPSPPPEEASNSSVDSEGRPWTVSKYMMRHPALSGADLRRALMRKGLMTAGKTPAKRPRDEVDEGEEPDLATFFDEHDTPKDKRISMCRAYATYVASTQTKKKKVVKAKKTAKKQ